MKNEKVASSNHGPSQSASYLLNGALVRFAEPQAIPVGDRAALNPRGSVLAEVAPGGQRFEFRLAGDGSLALLWDFELTVGRGPLELGLGNVIERAHEALREKLLTLREVCELLRVKATWVRQHTAELGVIRLGRGRGADLRFPLEEVRRYLQRAVLASRRGRRG